MMKVLLINPNYRNVYKYVGSESTMIQPPLGLAYLAAVLRQNKVDVSILDLAALNLNDEQSRDEIKKSNANFIGITAATNTVEEAYKIAKYAKEINAFVIVGGPHTSILPKQTLEECKDIDIAVKGEGEYILLDIVKKKPLSKIKGITYRKGSKIHSNADSPLIEDLDSIPFPARDLLPLDRYWSPGVRRYPFATIVTSRGCPYNCSFCVNYTVSGRKFRYRSPENILKEIDELVNKYKVKELNILDDNFTVIPNRVEKLCDELIKRNYDLIWKTGNGVRADRVNEHLIKKMKEAGCYLLAFGIESGDESILKIVDKGETLEQIESAVRWAKKYKILTEGFFIIGNDGENEETMNKTIKFAKKLDLNIAQFQVFIPLPGSSYYEKINRDGEIFAKSWKEYNAFGKPIFRYKELTPELMEKMQKKAYKQYYFRPKMLFKKLLEIRSFKQLMAYAMAGLAVLKFKND